MKKLIIAAALAWPFALAGAQDQPTALLDSLPGLGREPKEGPVAAADSAGGPRQAGVTEAVQRPDLQKTILELSALRLSSKQEERLSGAIGRKTEEFDRLMNEYDKTSAEEKKWRSKADSQRQELLKINQAMPDLIRDYLDEEQRQSYNAMLDAKNKPAIAETPAASDEIIAPKPVKKRRVLRKKRRLPAPAEAAVGATPPSAAGGGAIPPAPASAVPAEDEPGQVMVDKEQGALEQPVRKKRRVLRKKVAVPAKAPAPAEDIMANELPGEAPTGNQPPAAEEDAGSYP